MRTAIGLAISGREVRLAILGSEKEQLSILGLDTIFLDSSLEYQFDEENFIDNAPNTDAKDVFGLKDTLNENATDKGSQKHGNTNLEILYKFLFRHVAKKTKVALNIPVSMAKYQRLDSTEFKQSEESKEKPGGIGAEDGFNSEQHLLKLADGSTINLTHDQYPPFLSIMREVNDFLGKKLYFGLMDTTELALANIARSSQYTQPGKISVIVYIEDEFTRLIFLEGQELLHISSVINENAASPQVLDVISRRLMYEIDEAKIPEIDTILLAGRCSRIRAKSFFTEHFERAEVDFLSSTQAGNLPVEHDKQNERFSEFAVAIALAWKQLEPKNPTFFSLNLIPQELKDQQEILKLDRNGYALLAITGLIAFFITFQIISVRSEVSNIKNKSMSLQQEIDYTKRAVNEVLDIDDERKQLETNLSLADSLAKEHNSFLVFLKKLNASVQRTGDIWVNEISKNGATYSLNGSSSSRLKIPVLADKLGGAVLKKVTREKSDQNQFYHFSMDGIKAEKGEESASEAFSLANFTTFPNFTRDLFTGNISPVQSTPVKTERVSPPANSPASNGRNMSNLQINNTSTSRTRNSNSTINQQSKSGYAAKNPDIGKRTADFAQANKPVPSNSGSNHSSFSKAPEKPKLAQDGASNHSKESNGMTINHQNGVSSYTSSSNSEVKAKTNLQTRSLADERQSNPAKRYFIEVAQSEDRNYAERFATACRSKGLRTSVANYFDRNKGKQIYRVVLGNYPSKLNAEKAYALLADALGAAAMKNSRIIALDMPANN